MLTRTIFPRRALLASWLTLCLLAALMFTPTSYGDPHQDLSVEEMKRQMWEAQALSLTPEQMPPPQIPALEPAAGSPWERMVFQVFLEGSFELLIANTVGSGERRLTSTPFDETDPKLSRDGTDVVYVSNEHGSRDLYRLAVDRPTPIRLTSSPASEVDPVWSPDDMRIVYAANPGGNYDLFLMNADGTGTLQVTGDPAHDVMPTWSPDGRYLAWVRIGSDGFGTLWRHDLQTGNQQPIIGPIRFLQHPDWSPDGNQIAIDCDCDGDFLNELAVVKLDDLGPHIVHDPSSAGQLVDAWHGSWSADGRDLYHTLVFFELNGNQLLIRDAQVRSVRPYGIPRLVSNRQYAFLPHVRWIDSTPPALTLAPFPKYVRSLYNTYRLRILGEDIGPAGIESYTIIMERPSGFVQRHTYYPATHGFEITYRVSPGGPYQFSLAARDNAFNHMETWTAPHPMIVYRWAGNGIVLDQRGHAVVGADIRVDPFMPIVGAPSDLAGWYHVLTQRLGSQGNTLAAVHPGYGSATGRLAIDPDNADTPGFRLMLPPRQSYVTNGGFEHGLDGWKGVRQVLTTTLPFAGDVALQLGPGTPSLSTTHQISQSVAIPAGAHEPTLSFEVQHLIETPGPPTTVDVLINDTVHWSSSADIGPDWEHVWVDLEGWQGQTIELVFRLTEPAGGSARAWLDEVQLGEWWTPVVTDIEGMVTPAQPSPVTIRGANFDPAAAVLLDGAPLGGVQWVDEETLTVTLPPQPPGYSELLVRNPSGELGGTLLQVGSPTFIPQMTR